MKLMFMRNNRECEWAECLIAVAVVVNFIVLLIAILIAILKEKF